MCTTAAVRSSARSVRGVGMEDKSVDNPMHRHWPMNLSPRCGARTRSGSPCRSPAVNGKRRCRMHGGAAGSGAPEGKRNGRYRHGLYGREWLELKKALRELREGNDE